MCMLHPWAFLQGSLQSCECIQNLLGFHTVMYLALLQSLSQASSLYASTRLFLRFYCLVGHALWVLSISCHPDGNGFATGSSDSKVKLWDLQSRACVQTLADHTDQVSTSFPFFKCKASPRGLDGALVCVTKMHL